MLERLISKEEQYLAFKFSNRSIAHQEVSILKENCNVS